MRILIVHNRYRTSGGEDSHVSLQMSVLVENGHDVWLYSKDSSNVKTLSGKVETIGQMTYSIQNAKEFNDLLKKNKVDIVHVHNLYPLISPSILRIAKQNNIPIVMTLHNYRMVCPTGLLMRDGEVCELCGNGNYSHAVVHNCFGNLTQSIAYASILRLHRTIGSVTKYVDAYVSPSEFLKSIIVKFLSIPESSITVIPNAYKSEIAEVAIADMPLMSQGYALYIGRISREKGLETLLSAFARLSEKRLRIMGDGPLLETLKNKAMLDGMKNVEFLGYRTGDDFHRILSGADYTIVPSEWYENMPYAAIESLAFGVPVIASSIGGLKEIVIDGYNGRTFEVGNVNQLCCVIEEIESSNEELERLSRNAKRDSLERFSLDQFTRRLLGLYESLVSRV